MSSLHLNGQCLQLDKNIADSCVAWQVGHTVQPLQAQPLVEQVPALQPDTYVLTAHALRLKLNLKFNDEKLLVKQNI